MPTTLSISHNIFLTPEQRMSWFNGQNIHVIGVSCPIWHDEKTTSEPANEVFSIYTLLNSEENIFIRDVDNGYEITVPKEPAEAPPYNVFDKMTTDEKMHWQSQQTTTIKNILDIKDGGIEWLAFRQFNKTRHSDGLNIVHYVEIKDISELIDTLA